MLNLTKHNETRKLRYYRFLTRYSLFKKLDQLEENYQPKQIYSFLGCSKAYYFGLKEWRWDCKKEYLDRLFQLILIKDRNGTNEQTNN